MNGDEERYTDVVQETVARQGDIRLDAGVLRCSLTGDYSTGVRILGWEGEVVIIAGTDDGETRATVGQRFSPENAREIADGLRDAAGQAEDRAKRAGDPPDEADKRSWLRRLIS